MYLKQQASLVNIQDLKIESLAGFIFSHRSAVLSRTSWTVNLLLIAEDTFVVFSLPFLSGSCSLLVLG